MLECKRTHPYNIFVHLQRDVSISLQSLSVSILNCTFKYARQFFTSDMYLVTIGSNSLCYADLVVPLIDSCGDSARKFKSDCIRIIQ
jgi:hypothetical protein